MNTIEIKNILTTIFNKKLSHDRTRHIVFWYDEAGEFTDEIKDLSLDNVRVWEFSDHNLFATKYELEVNDTTSNFLLYSQQRKPLPQEDWLINLYKLGNEFTADRITITMRQLGIEDDSLRNLFKEYSQFFNNKSRLESFKSFKTDIYTDEIVDINILSVLTKSKINTMDEVLKSLFRYVSKKDDTAWKSIQKYGNEEKFWALIEKHYGYTKEKSLISLITFMMMTYTTEQNVDITYPKTWTAYVGNRPTNVIIFMDQWMNHRNDRLIYNNLANEIEQLSKIEMHIREWDIDEISSFDTFEIFDQRIVTYIIDQLLNNVGHYQTYEQLILDRRKTHWFTEYKYIYEAIIHAISFLKHIDELDGFIQEESAIDIFQSYVSTYYNIDTDYRKFYTAYDMLTSRDFIRPLREKIENTYTNWFIEELSLQWTNAIEKNENWFLPSVQQQNYFYDDWVQPYIDNDQRVFVIISDALRYEVATELLHKISNEKIAATELTAIQGVIPSYTALGMASLLPHQQLKITSAGEVFCDNHRTNNTNNREQILRKSVPESIAITAKELNTMDRSELRNTFSGMKVIYIYHNAIDAIGDNPATENEVFFGAKNAIKDIRTLINRMVTNLSAANILVTADHGFIYQRDKVQRPYLIPKNQPKSIIANRRFMIAENKEKPVGTLSFPLNQILKDDGSGNVIVPKGVDRFQVQGAGANYVHGGTMLQEIVLPVIKFKNDRSKSDRNTIKQVNVNLTSQNRNITSESFLLEFFQSTPVEDKTLPRYLNIYFTDEKGEEISNICRVFADTKAQEAYERTFKEQFILKSINYDRTKNYYLIMEDLEGNLYERHTFSIDLIY